MTLPGWHCAICGGIIGHDDICTECNRDADRFAYRELTKHEKWLMDHPASAPCTAEQLLTAQGWFSAVGITHPLAQQVWAKRRLGLPEVVSFSDYSYDQAASLLLALAELARTGVGR